MLRSVVVQQDEHAWQGWVQLSGLMLLVAPVVAGAAARSPAVQDAVPMQWVNS
jgi:hypothetical protein